MVRWVALLAVLGCSAPQAVPVAPVRVDPAVLDEPPIVGELPPVPAGALPRTFQPVEYAAALEVDPAQSGFGGTIEITGDLATPTSVIWLHAENLTVHRVTISRDGTTQRLVAKMPAVGLVALQAAADLVPGRYTISVQYRGRWTDDDSFGGFRERVGNAAYVFSQFEPDYARRVFPCIDEPDRKVPWQLTITAPRDLQVVSNTPIAKQTPAGTTTTTVFEKTLPTPSYLVAFAVGPFEVVDAGTTKRGMPLRIFALRGRAKHAAHAAAVTATIFDQIDDWIGVPLPYPKLDFVAVPHTSHVWSGMENTGMVTFREATLRAGEWEPLAGHEIAHHWFGNLVTGQSWRDLWLNEAFAEWLSETAARRGILTELESIPGSIIDPDVSPRARMNHRPMREKGPMLLEKLARHLGVDRFRAVLKAYLGEHAHGTATTEDFRRALEGTTGDATLGTLLEGYLTHTAWRPLEVSLACTKKRFAVRIDNRSLDDSIVCVTYDRDGARGEKCQRLGREDTGFVLDSKRCPRWVLSDGSLAAGKLTPAQFAIIRDLAWPVLNDQERYRIAASVANHHDQSLYLSLVDRLVISDHAWTRSWLHSYLWHLRDNIPDAAVRARFDSWIRDSLTARAREQGFAADPLLAALVTVAGDSVLLDEARAVLDKQPFAKEALVRADASYTEQLFERVLADELTVDKGLLSRSPFLLDLMRKHVAKLGKSKAAWFLVMSLCEVPSDDLETLARAVDPTRWEHIVKTAQASTCARERAKTTAAVKAFLDGRTSAKSVAPKR